MGAREVPLAKYDMTPTRSQFALQGGPDLLTFDGAPAKKGMSGTVRQGAVTGDFTLVKLQANDNALNRKLEAEAGSCKLFGLAGAPCGRRSRVHRIENRQQFRVPDVDPFRGRLLGQGGSLAARASLQPAVLPPFHGILSRHPMPWSSLGAAAPGSWASRPPQPRS